MSLSEYPLIQLPGTMTPENREPLGSKMKLWFRDPNSSASRILFKYNRPSTGEDWSEKIAAELAQLLRLPHARVELAIFEQARGAALMDFTDNERYALVHGNEVLEFVDSSYPSQQRYGAMAHTVRAVVTALARFKVGVPNSPEALPGGVTDACGVFLGYLLLDAWIGNTDRHHENWGVLRQRNQTIQLLTLAPTYDHASSLGRELNDAQRMKLGNPRHGTPAERYAKRARSAFYASDGSGRKLSTHEVFTETAAHHPKAAQGWVERLRDIDRLAQKDAVDRVPSGHMSDTAKAFACALLDCNAKLLGAG